MRLGGSWVPFLEIEQHVDHDRLHVMCDTFRKYMSYSLCDHETSAQSVLHSISGPAAKHKGDGPMDECSKLINLQICMLMLL